MRHYNERTLGQCSFKTFDIAIGRSTQAQLYCLDSFGEVESAQNGQEKHPFRGLRERKNGVWSGKFPDRRRL